MVGVAGPTGSTGAAGPQGAIGQTGAQGSSTTANSSTPSGSTVAAVPAQDDTVKDRTPQMEEEYAAAVKVCESATFNKEKCINAAKEHFGRM
jgi:hypothetical protein